MNGRNNRDKARMKTITASALNQLAPMDPVPTEVTPMGQIRSPVRCLLCDIYGTLLISESGDIADSTGDHRKEKSLSELFSSYDVDILPDLAVKRFKDAIYNTHSQRRATGVAFPEVDVVTIWQSLLFRDDPSKARPFALDFETIMNPVWRMPGLSALLKTARNGSIAMGIVSNAQFYTPIVMEYLIGCKLNSVGFDPELVIFSFQHGIAKPSRRLFHLAAERLLAKGIAPKETVFVGNDMRNDIKPAQSEGFQTVLFAGDLRSLRMRRDDPGCAAIAPDGIITHLDQLTETLVQTIAHENEKREIHVIHK